MIELLNRTGKQYFFSEYGGRRVLLLIFPYVPFADAGGAIVDGYYPASNAGYFFAKSLSEQLAAAGFPNRFPVSADFKRLLLAADAGFFLGKNTLCYHRAYGSRFCIEALELGETEGADGSRPEATCERVSRAQATCDGCGACARACPTGAISEKGFDPRRCLRSLMNETRFSEEIARKIGRRLYGCDVCQRVCPHNAGVGETENPLAEFLQYRNLLPAAACKKSLAPLLPLFGANYLRPRRILNLALVGAGNSGDKSLAPLVEGYLTHEEPSVRENAARALALLKNGGMNESF